MVVISHRTSSPEREEDTRRQQRHSGVQRQHAGPMAERRGGDSDGGGQGDSEPHGLPTADPAPTGASPGKAARQKSVERCLEPGAELPRILGKP